MAFFCSPPPSGDQPAQLTIGFPVGAEQDQGADLWKPELGADNQLQGQIVVLDRPMSTYHTRHRAFVSQSKGFITQLGSLETQLFRMGGSPQKAEIAEAVKFCVAHQPNQP